MGRWATYLIGRERQDPPAAYARHSKTTPGWVWWELPLAQGDPWDPGPGHAVVAHIFDSDVADIRGLTAGNTSWRWVYGETTLAGFEGRSVDSFELEDSLPGRAAEAAQLILGWAADGGLVDVDVAAIAEILQRGYTFAEEGVMELVTALGIVAADSSVEYQDLDPTVGADGGPVQEASELRVWPEATGPTMAGALAAPIDHSSDAWRGLVAEFWLDSFGEPPALVALDGTVFVAFDPPIVLVSYGRDAERSQVAEHLGVQWQEIPSAHADGVTAAAAWARANVGVQGRAADEHRLRLNSEVPPEYPDGLDPFDVSRHGWWQHSIAAPQHAGLELAMGTDLLQYVEEVADWLDHARSLLLTPLAAAYAERGGPVHADADDPPGYALSLQQVYKSVRGRYTHAGADDASWRRALKRLRAGELTLVELKGSVTNGFGQLRGIEPWGNLRVGAQLAADQSLYSLPAHLTVKISDPLRALVPGPFVDDLVTRAVAAGLPVVGGWVDAGRSLAMGDVESRYEAAARVRSDVRPDPRTSVRGPAWRILLGPEHLRLLGGREVLEASGVFTGFREIGALLQVECGAQPAECTWERRAAQVDVLAPLLPALPDR
ncbi:MAG TPA: hypothetical protein VG497_13240 [Kribbella sp.]|nr:hypothetical protein [Kribbella sp.]